MYFHYYLFRHSGWSYQDLIKELQNEDIWLDAIKNGKYEKFCKFVDNKAQEIKQDMWASVDTFTLTLQVKRNVAAKLGLKGKRNGIEVCDYLEEWSNNVNKQTAGRNN